MTSMDWNYPPGCSARDVGAELPEQTWPLILVEINGQILIPMTHGLVMPDARCVALDACRNAGLDGVEFEGGYVAVHVNSVMAVENVQAIDENDACQQAIESARERLQAGNLETTALSFEAVVECGPGQCVPEVDA